jgi:hypothetical protein
VLPEQPPALFTERGIAYRQSMLAAYLDEMIFRFNRRENANLFLDTLRRTVSVPVLPFEKLTA